LLRVLGAKRPRLIFLFPENFFHGVNGSPEAALTVFDPVKRVVGALRRQLDSCATSFAAHEQWAKEVREGVIPEPLFTVLLRCRFWSPVNKARSSES
jgi:hypothetical protein